MTGIKDIESAVAQLSAEELAAFRAWFADFDASEWDAEFEQDVPSGRLDALAAEALGDLRHGRSTALRGKRDETRMP